MAVHLPILSFSLKAFLGGSGSGLYAFYHKALGGLDIYPQTGQLGLVESCALHHMSLGDILGRKG
jgi:hypothetical protein